jgi:hypothetical protein
MRKDVAVGEQTFNNSVFLTSGPIKAQDAGMNENRFQEARPDIGS